MHMTAPHDICSVSPVVKSSAVRPVFQRRDDYRLDVPTEDEASCTFRFARKFDRPAYAVRLELFDISGGGLSVLDHDNRLADVVGSVVKDCELQLPGQHKLLFVDLRLLHAQPEPVSSKHAVTRINCQFVNLSDASSLAIRRYVAHLERRQIARRRDRD